MSHALSVYLPYNVAVDRSAPVLDLSGTLYPDFGVESSFFVTVTDRGYGLAETGVFSPEDLYSPEVLAGLNPEMLQRVFSTPEKQEALVTILRTRPEFEDFDQRIAEIQSQLSPEILAGLNPDAILSVAASAEKSAAFTERLETRPIFEKKSLFDKITGGISGAVGETLSTTRRAIKIFLILVVIVVILIVFTIAKRGGSIPRGVT